MRIKLISAAALTVAAAGALATSAHAETVTDCRAVIVDLRDDTATATSLGRSGPGLVRKVDEAVAKLDENKLSDTRQKLTDYESALDALFFTAKPKVSEGDFAELSTDVDAAIACIDAVGASADA